MKLLTQKNQMRPLHSPLASILMNNIIFDSEQQYEVNTSVSGI